MILDSLEIKNFRAFKHLTIERLARVNLIVGENNIGKTCLLEALWLYASRGDLKMMNHILASRNEFVGNDKSKSLSFNHLFYGREGTNTLIQIVDITIRKLINQEGVTTTISPMWEEIPCVLVPTKGLSPTEIKQLWHKIELTPTENDIIAALQIIEPNILRVALREHLPMVRLSDSEQPVMLSSLGEGMNHIFELALALVNVKNGILLIDEIENGFHYSVQTEIWEFIFEVTKRLNIQVFATTHSWDAIRAFQLITQDIDDDAGLLISLWDKKDKPGEIFGVIADKEDLKVIIRSQIEVR
jgi:AAA15 family ATPase/GTPase